MAVQCDAKQPLVLKWSHVITNAQKKIDDELFAKQKAENDAIQSKQKAEHALAVKTYIRSRELGEFLSNMLKKSGGKPVVAPGHPNFGSIIRTDESVEYDYLYIGCYHDPLTLRVCMSGDQKTAMIISDACPMFVVEYDPESVNYMVVRSVFKHAGKYHYIPGSFSLMGTMDPNQKWTLVEQAKPHSIGTLSYNICEKICPGFLD
jgi:hypothetical protein